MSWVRMIRGQRRKIRPDLTDDSFSNESKSSVASSGMFRFPLSRQDTNDMRQDMEKVAGGSPLKNESVAPSNYLSETKQPSIASRLTHLISSSKRVVDIDNESDDGQMGLFHRAVSNESMLQVREAPKSSPAPASRFKSSLPGHNNSSRLRQPFFVPERAFSKASSNRAVISLRAQSTVPSSKNTVLKHHTVVDNILGTKLTKSLNSILSFLQSKALYVQPILLLSQKLDITKLRQNEKFVITSDIIHIILSITALFLIPSSPADLLMVKITYSLMTACVLIFFFVRLTPLIPLPDYIEATVLQYRPYIDFVKFILLGVLFWVTTVLSVNFGTRFYAKIAICYKLCRFHPYDGSEGLTLNCDREYANGTALCSDDVFTPLRSEIDNVNTTSYVLSLFQVVEIIMLTMVVFDLCQAIKDGKLFPSKEEDDEELNEDLDENVPLVNLEAEN